MDINNSNYPNTDTDSDHNHDDPHDSSSDDTPSDMQEELQSEEEHFESADSEDKVKSDLKPKTESVKVTFVSSCFHLMSLTQVT